MRELTGPKLLVQDRDASNNTQDTFVFRSLRCVQFPEVSVFLFEETKTLFLICCVFSETCMFAYLGLAIFSFTHIVKPALVIWSIVSTLPEILHLRDKFLQCDLSILLKSQDPTRGLLHHREHVWLVGCAVFQILILIGRAVNIYPLSFLANFFREHKITRRQQFIMWFSGQYCAALRLFYTIYKLVFVPNWAVELLNCGDSSELMQNLFKRPTSNLRLFGGTERLVSVQTKNIPYFWTISGLRGAIAFALSLHLEFENEKRHVIVTTTLIIVLFTVLILGGSTMPLMKVENRAHAQWAVSALNRNSKNGTEPGCLSGQPKKAENNDKVCSLLCRCFHCRQCHWQGPHILPRAWMALQPGRWEIPLFQPTVRDSWIAV